MFLTVPLVVLHVLFQRMLCGSATACHEQHSGMRRFIAEVRYKFDRCDEYDHISLVILLGRLRTFRVSSGTSPYFFRKINWSYTLTSETTSNRLGILRKLFRIPPVFLKNRCGLCELLRNIIVIFLHLAYVFMICTINSRNFYWIYELSVGKRP